MHSMNYNVRNKIHQSINLQLQHFIALLKNWSNNILCAYFTVVFVIITKYLNTLIFYPSVMCRKNTSTPTSCTVTCGIWKLTSMNSCCSVLGCWGDCTSSLLLGVASLLGVELLGLVSEVSSVSAAAAASGLAILMGWDWTCGDGARSSAATARRAGVWALVGSAGVTAGVPWLHSWRLTTRKFS